MDINSITCNKRMLFPLANAQMILNICEKIVDEIMYESFELELYSMNTRSGLNFKFKVI